MKKSSEKSNSNRESAQASPMSGASGSIPAFFTGGSPYAARQQQQQAVIHSGHTSVQRKPVSVTGNSPVQRMISYKDRQLNDKQVMEILTFLGLEDADTPYVNELQKSDSNFDLLYLVAGLRETEDVGEKDRLIINKWFQSLAPIDQISLVHAPVVDNNNNNIVLEEKPQISRPNTQRARVGDVGFGVFNLFSYAGKSWIATAYHCIRVISGYGTPNNWTSFNSTGTDNAVPFFIGNQWAKNGKLVLADEDADYALFEVIPGVASYPSVKLGTVNGKSAEKLTVLTPRVSEGVGVTTKDLRRPREIEGNKPERFIYESGLMKYQGKTQGGDSGSAIVNVHGEFVGLHHSDFGGFAFQEGKTVFQFLTSLKE